MTGLVRQWVALSFLGLLLVKAWVAPLIYLDFELRRDYIVNNLCVNRNRPELHCDGKCYLAKRLEAAKEQEQQQTERAFMFKLIDTAADGSFHTNLLPAIAIADRYLPKVNYLHFISGISFRFITDIFHPPKY